MYTNYMLAGAVAAAEIFSFVRGEYFFCLILASVFVLYGIIRTLINFDIPGLNQEFSVITNSSENSSAGVI